MKQLLKLYCQDFLEKALYLYLVVWGFGLVIKYISGKEEFLSTILITIFLFLYPILFLFSYPLTKCLKWVLYTPIPKSELIWFNIIFQIYKLSIILFLFLTLILFKMSFGPDDVFMDFSKMAMVLEKYPFAFTSPIFDSSLIFGLGLFATFILGIVFSVSPQLMIENKYHLGPRNKNYGYYFHKYKKYMVLLIPLGFLLKYTQGYWSSPLFIISFGISYIIFAILWSYSDKLILTKATHNKVFIAGGALLVFNLIFTYGYSNLRLNSQNLPIAEKVNEILFQKKFYSALDEKILMAALESPLTAPDILSLTEIYGARTGSIRKGKDGKEHKPHHGFPEILHDFKNLDYRKIITSKNNIMGLQAALGLFDLPNLSFDKIGIFLEKWDQLSKEQKGSATSYFVADRLNDYPFQKDHLISLLRSKNETMQYVALKAAPAYPQYQLEGEILNNVLDYSNDNLALASQIVSKLQCRSISSVELVGMQKGGNQLPPSNPSGCPKELKN